MAVVCSLAGTLVSADEPRGQPFRLDIKKDHAAVAATVRGGSDGYEVVITVRQSAPGETVQASSNGAGLAEGVPPSHGGSGHRSNPSAEPNQDNDRTTASPVVVTVWTPDGEGTRRQIREYPGIGTYYSPVEGESQGVLWNPAPRSPALPADVRPTGGGGLDPREVALDILARIPLPELRVRANPSLGLVALPSWYWVEGYDGGSFGESRTVTIPPAVGAEVPTTVVPADHPSRQGTSFTVEVRVWGSRYDWSFGDGKGLTTRSLGRPWPAESDIQHTYQHSSLPFANGFPVRITAEYSAEFRVDGGAPQGLPSVRRTYGSDLRVQEIQPVLVQRR